MALADEVRDTVPYTLDSGGVIALAIKHKYAAATPAATAGQTATQPTVGKPAGLQPRHVWLEAYSGQKTERRKMIITSPAGVASFPAGTQVTLSDGLKWAVAGYVGEKIRRGPGTNVPGATGNTP